MVQPDPICINHHELPYRIIIKVANEGSREPVQQAVNVLAHGIWPQLPENIADVYTAQIPNNDVSALKQAVVNRLREQDQEITLTVNDIWIEKRPLGLNKIQDNEFNTAGEQNRVRYPHGPGAFINSNENDPNKKMIFVRAKRMGVEPGFETIYLRDLQEGGLFYETAIQIYNAANKGNDQPGFNEWIMNNDNRTKVVKELSKTPDLLNQGLYFVKLDYRREPHTDNVRIPTHRAQNRIHRRNTEAHYQEKNVGAVMEVLANDVYRALGMPSQEAVLIKSRYEPRGGEEHGPEKLLVACKCVTGPQGERWTTFDGNIKQGRLIGNRLVGDPDPNNLRGDFVIYTLNKKSLALAKMSQRALGDRDGVGKTGSNIGYYIDKDSGEVKIVNIDPGKSLESKPKYSPENKAALFAEAEGRMFGFIRKFFIRLRILLSGETDRMAIHDFHSDCTFSEPKGTIRDRFQGGYINFSIFDDTTLVENIAAVKQLLDTRGSVNRVFDDYLAAFPGENDQNTQKRTAITEAKNGFNLRLDYFEAVLRDRLTLSDNELTLLENLEKQTSRTTNIAGKGKKAVVLQHLQIVPGKRKEWTCTQNQDDTRTFTFNGNSEREARNVGEALLNAGLSIPNDFNINDRIVTMTLTRDRIANLIGTEGDNFLNESRIAERKNQHLFNEGPIRINDIDYDLSKREDYDKFVTFLKSRNSNLARRQKSSYRKIARSATRFYKSKSKMNIKKQKNSMKEAKKRIKEDTQNLERLRNVRI